MNVTIDPKFLIERQGKQFVLYAGLLDAAHRNGLAQITTKLVQAPAEENRWTAIFEARVLLADPTNPAESIGFTGYGDANAENVGRNIAMHYIRMAETRSKARALRDALNIGTAAVEELGDDDNGQQQAPAPRQEATPTPIDRARQMAPPPQQVRPHTGQPNDGATPAQIGLLSRLTKQLRISQEVFGKAPERMTKREASTYIEQLKARLAADDGDIPE